MKIFAIDTSARSASVAVTDGGEIKGEFFINTMLTHSETLMPMADALLQSTHLALSDIDCFAVNTGPGSFTGLRIGIAAVKGMAFALGKPCAAVSTLESMAYNISEPNVIVCAVMDARCNQVYTACFEGCRRISPDEAILIDELKERLLKYRKPVLFSGDGAELVYSRLKDAVPACSIADEAERYPTAENAAKLTAEKLENGEKTVSADKLLPVYLRVPQAQRELNKKNNIKGDI